MSFAKFIETRLFRPLGMKATGFSVPQADVGRLAAIHWSKDCRLTTLDELLGHPAGGGPLVQPWSANRYTTRHAHTGGSFGLVSTAEDYRRFAQMMLNGGEFSGARLLSPQTIGYMTRDHLGPIGIQGPNDEPSGIGFGVLKDPAAAGYLGSAGTYFWARAAGTQFWIDPKEDLVVVAMIQHMGTPTMGSFEPQLRALMYSALLH